MSLESLISATDLPTASEPVTHAVDTTAFSNSGNASVFVEEPLKDMYPMKALKKRNEFFIQLVYLSVEDQVYSIPERMLPGQEYLKSVVGVASGHSEYEPLELDITVSQMNSLTSVLLASQLKAPLELTITQWGEALAIATLWKLDAP
ncbi:hypothetical protein FRB93_007900 [Tulasnella sp. JGI-2019a]|nr:hypothetical protein FRB93_007900 [Tulasnella sp. JGI-2019a]